MGLVMSAVFDRLFIRETRVLMLGLDAAGKTTLLYKLKLGEVIHTIPTIGFNVEQVQYKNLSMSVWDVGGQDKIRLLWRHYYHGTDALVFVVDSNDRPRMTEARDELHRILSDPDMDGSPLVLVYSNKTDLPGALSTSAIAEAMQLHKLKNVWYIQPASATNGVGVYEGLEWLSSQMKLRPARSKGSGG